MIRRIAVSQKTGDARARHYLDTLKTAQGGAALSRVLAVSAYSTDAKLSAGELVKAAASLTNPLIEEYTIDKVPTSERFAFVLEIGYLPGVTDNIGTTAKESIEDAIGRRFKEGEAVYSSLFLFLEGSISKKDAENFARELSNPLIERATVYSEAEAKKKIPIIIPKVKLDVAPRASEVNLNVPQKELERIGKEGIKDKNGVRRGPLALTPRAMATIRDHFKHLGRNPTDVELEALAQTWSEHCKHTIFADPLDNVKEGIYKRYIKGATEKIRKTKGKKDFCVSVFKDNSGAIAFGDEYLLTHKVETHNAPSALDPFGGSVTAIVGVNRDCLGFGLGAKPIANVYGFFVGIPQNPRIASLRGPESSSAVSPSTSPDDSSPAPRTASNFANSEETLYRDAKRTQPMLSPRRILEGVVHGVNAGGNQSGIPTPLGFVAVDPSYRGKPLVFGGTVGLIPRTVHGKKMYEKKAEPGDYIVMLGGRVGLDGIHGATFSSESLSKGSPATAVQIGDPITQKKFSDALVREARDADLYNSITDNGAGGLSGSVGEMAREAGGCEVDLEKVPLKYPGLHQWQVWISESQERMTLAVPKAKWKAFKKIMDRHDVEASVIGTFTKSGNCVVRYKGKKVMDLSLAFLHDGRPIEARKTRKVAHKAGAFKVKKEVSIRDAILELLVRPNIGSSSFIAMQYDHDVQGRAVTPPLQGKGRVSADSAVIKPLYDSPRGAVLAHGYCPWYSASDTYAMSAAAIDTAVRNAVCAGASREALAILDNFCWSSSDKPDRLYELKRAAEACYDTAVGYGTPFISGKDSMFNDFRGFDAKRNPIHIAALPTLLVSALGVIPDVARAMTLDFKAEGDAIYIVGDTNDELGESEYAHLAGATGGAVPKVNMKKNARLYDAVAKAIGGGLVASAIGVGRGGLATALAKSAIGGQIGASVDLARIPGKAKSAESTLFSESQGRILVSVRKGSEKAFEKTLASSSYVKIGEVRGHTLSITLKDSTTDLLVSALTDSYRSFFKHW